LNRCRLFEQGLYSSMGTGQKALANFSKDW
jgi:hypothetical protein